MSELRTIGAEFEFVTAHICMMKNWDHVFIKFEMPGTDAVLYYDPWYGRCVKHNTINSPYFFSETELKETLRDMVDNLIDDNVITHSPYARRTCGSFLKH